MQKKLLTIAVAAALAAPLAATADVTVYGKMHFSYDFVSTDETSNPADINAMRLSGDDSDDVAGTSRASRFGLKGSEDLGGGLKAIYQIETQLETEGSSLGLRNTYVGLAGGWGEVRVGRHDTPYKLSTAKLDIFTDYVSDYNNIISSFNGFVRGVLPGGAVTTAPIAFGLDSRLETAAYLSPNFNGFQGAIARVTNSTAEPLGFDEDVEAWSLMLSYDNGPLYIGFGYEDRETASAAAATQISPGVQNAEFTAWKLGASYKFGNSLIGGVYENIEFDTSVVNAAGVTTNTFESERDAWMLNFQHAFGANVLKLQYAQADDFDDLQATAGAAVVNVATAGTGGDMWAIGLDHNFSKRTTLYAVYSALGNDNATNGYRQFGGTDADDTYDTGMLGGDVDVISVGIIHNF